MIKHNVILHIQEGGGPNLTRRNTNREPSLSHYLQGLISSINSMIRYLRRKLIWLEPENEAPSSESPLL